MQDIVRARVVRPPTVQAVLVARALVIPVIQPVQVYVFLSQERHALSRIEGWNSAFLQRASSTEMTRLLIFAPASVSVPMIVHPTMIAYRLVKALYVFQEIAKLSFARDHLCGSGKQLTSLLQCITKIIK